MNVFMKHLFSYTVYVFCFVFMLQVSLVAAQQGERFVNSQSVNISPAAKKLREEVVYKLLRAAQVALKNNQLTTPEHANAYDLFQSALTLAPSNAVAKNGIQAILIRYAALIRDRLQQRDIRGASHYLSVAQARFPHNSLLNDLRKKIASDKEAFSASRLPLDGSIQQNHIVVLNARLLSQKADAIKAQMVNLGTKLAKSKEGVLIYARSDREGRWLYKMINKAAVGYRVRGDIKLSKDPKIIIQPPY